MQSDLLGMRIKLSVIASIGIVRSMIACRCDKPHARKRHNKYFWDNIRVTNVWRYGNDFIQNKKLKIGLNIFNL